MFNIFPTKGIDRVSKLISKPAITDKEFIESEIVRWKNSKQRKAMIQGIKYYTGEHDILHRKRTVIGQNGKLQEVNNLPNNKVIDNQYAKVVDQKISYLLEKPFTLDSEDKIYQKILGDVFNSRFRNLLKNIGCDALNCGIGWVYPYYNEEGKFNFKRFKPFEILPFWKDAEHTILDMVVRVYEVEVYNNYNCEIVEKVEIYHPDKIEYYELKNNTLCPEKNKTNSNYIILEDESGFLHNYNWSCVPFIPFKYNNKEIPLIKKVKSLQDGINTMLSDFENNMQEDARNTILIIKNYDGTNLAEFRHNLATYGAVKVRTVDGSDGGVDALQVQVNAENYKTIIEMFKKALIENAMGYDAKNDRLFGNPNQMNIQSMYSDIDLDANSMESEFKASFEQLIKFINIYLANSGKGDFDNSKVDIIFNRDIMMNEAEVIESCRNSVGILSEETIIAQHPWVINADQELKRKEKEEQPVLDEYIPSFKPKK
ncbi:MAG: phage portal protein [Clostridia bacterium]|nr:phage portal protein [Clostridia bacterium]